MTASTRRRVWPLVGRLPDSTCETVLIETFAARATSRMVMPWRVAVADPDTPAVSSSRLSELVP